MPSTEAGICRAGLLVSSKYQYQNSVIVTFSTICGFRKRWRLCFRAVCREFVTIREIAQYSHRCNRAFPKLRSRNVQGERP
jgi:hypothetical protein